jgi:hypothetical protein
MSRKNFDFMQPSSKRGKLMRAKFPCHGFCRMQGNPCLSYPWCFEPEHLLKFFAVIR